VNDLLEKVKQIKPYSIKIRRELHACAELGFEEYKTSKIIQRELKKLGIPFKIAAKTGVVALIKGAYAGKVIAVRADMDALPIEEETGLPFASGHKGIMHACGHDVHMACALSLAKLLSEMKKELKGSVKLIFQPHEEMGKFNLDGAKKMIEEGVMKAPVPKAVIGLHVHPPLQTGAIELNYGKIYANADVFEIKVKGSGGHGSAPEETIDPVIAAAVIIMNLQSIVSRNVSPFSSAVISITMLKAGETTNVIPPEVLMLGTVRTLDNNTRRLVKQRMQKIISSTAKAFGATAGFNYTDGYPYFSNNSALAGLIEKAAAKIIGKKNVHISKQPSMGGENFGHFAKIAPGCYFNLGVADKKKKKPLKLHNSKFDVDENALYWGTAILAQACFDFLDKK